MRCEVIAVGCLRAGALRQLWEEYTGRIRWSLALHEVESKETDPARRKDSESRKILRLINPAAYVIVLDERGRSLPSAAFAKTLENVRNTGCGHIQCIIGGAWGVTEPVRARANLLLGFGAQTWPHMLARVMLAEQLYRAEQIIAGSSYHKE